MTIYLMALRRRDLLHISNEQLKNLLVGLPLSRATLANPYQRPLRRPDQELLAGCLHERQWRRGVAREAARLSRELKVAERENRKLEKELARKDKALDETVALLVLRKKADAIWGIQRTND